MSLVVTAFNFLVFFFSLTLIYFWIKCEKKHSSISRGINHEPQILRLIISVWFTGAYMVYILFWVVDGVEDNREGDLALNLVTSDQPVSEVTTLSGDSSKPTSSYDHTESQTETKRLRNEKRDEIKVKHILFNCTFFKS